MLPATMQKRFALNAEACRSEDYVRRAIPAWVQRRQPQPMGLGTFKSGSDSEGKKCL